MPLVKTTGKAAVLVGAASIGDFVAGIGAVDTVLDQAEKVQSVASRSSKLWAVILTPRVFVTLLVLTIGVCLWKWGSKIEWRRLLDAKSGANLGR